MMTSRVCSRPSGRSNPAHWRETPPPGSTKATDSLVLGLGEASPLHLPVCPLPLPASPLPFPVCPLSCPSFSSVTSGRVALGNVSLDRVCLNRDTITAETFALSSAGWGVPVQVEVSCEAVAAGWVVSVQDGVSQCSL